MDDVPKQHKMYRERMKLHKSAEIVRQALFERGAECNVIELSESARTADEAALAIGCQVGQIVKSLLFCTRETKRPVLILVSGSNRVDEKGMQKYTGEKIRKADPEFTRDVTGFAIGGIPPIGHKSSISSIFIDEDLLQYDLLWAAAGTPHAVFSLTPGQLLEMTGGISAIVKERI